MAAIQDRRPTREDITAWISAIGGDISTLPYNMPVQGVGGEEGTPQLINVINYAAIWGQFYFQVSRDMAYHLLQFHADVRGDANTRALPDNWSIRLPPTGPNAVRRFLDQIFSGDPQFTVTFPAIRDSARRTQLEQEWTSYLQGELQREEQSTAQSPLDTMKLHTVAYGAGSRYDVLDLNRWPDRPKKLRRESRDDFNERMKQYEAKRRSISPFVVRTVHPLNFAWDLTTDPPQWALIREPIFPWDAQKQYPFWHPGETFRPAPGQTPYVRVEWWTPDWHAVYINGEAALGPGEGADDEGVVRNNYGHIPITFAAGGNGETDVANRPEVMLQGLLRKIRPILLEHALLTQLIGVYERAISFGPKKYVQGPETDIDGSRGNDIVSSLMAGPQDVARVPINWNVGTIAPPIMPPEIINRLQQLEAQIEAATAYEVAAGAPQTGPAFKMQLQIAQTQKRTSLDVLHLQQAMEMWARNRLLALKHMLSDEKVGANFGKAGETPVWVDLDPSTIPDEMEITCNLTTDSDTEKARKEQSGLALFEQKLIDDLGFWRDYMDDPNPEQRVADMIAYILRQQVTMPALIQIAQQGMPAVLAAIAQQQGITSLPAPAAPTSDMSAGQPQQPPQQQPSSPAPNLQTGPQGPVLPNETQNGPLRQLLNPNMQQGKYAGRFPNIVGAP